MNNKTIKIKKNSYIQVKGISKLALIKKSSTLQTGGISKLIS
jgi:hypothetical protein